MLHAGNMFDPSLRFRVIINNRQAALIFFDRQRNLRGQNIVWIKTRRDVLQLDETLDEQTGAGEKNKGEHGFCDDKTVAQPVAMSAGGRPASALLQRFG